MITTVISGQSKGVGKTTLINIIISNLKVRVGVIKTSLTTDIAETIITAEPQIVKAKNTDTSYFLQNGAEKVVYLRTVYDQLQNDLSEAIELATKADIELLLIEGNSVLDYLNPDLCLYLTKKDLVKKPSAFKAEAKADLIIKYEDLTSVLNKEKDELQNINLTFNNDGFSCYKAHLISKIIGIKLADLGQKFDEEGIKVNSCQLGLF